MDQPLCSECGAPLAADQLYCLECGERYGHARLDPLAFARGPRGDVAGTTTAQGRRLPAPRWLAAAGLVTLLAGAALGAAAGPGTPASALAAAAASAEPIIVALAPAPIAATAPPAEPEPAAAAPVEPPVDTAPAQLEPEPAPAEPPPATTDEPADPEPAAEPATPKVPPIENVWLIMLTGHGFNDAFGRAPVDATTPPPAPASPYLARELPMLGTLLPLYYAVARGPLPNGIALLSGRAPNPDTLAGCPVFDDCAYPARVPTLADQLTGAGLTWRAYIEGTSDVPPGTPVSCTQPSPRIPFVYFRSIIDTPECGSSVVGLDRLAPDLAAPDQTPAFSYIVPSACHDGSEAPCTEGAPAGLAATEPWLREVVGQITATAAYRDGGLVVITFDHEPAPPGVATPDTERDVPLHKRGGSVGALLLSPYVEPGATVLVTTGHLSLLRTLQDVFGVPHLGHAADPELHHWGPGVFKRWSPNVHDKTTGR